MEYMQDLIAEIEEHLMLVPIADREVGEALKKRRELLERCIKKFKELDDALMEAYY